MKVEQISLINFRNYTNCCIKLDSLVNVFYGNNAQGKTNLLEGIFYSAFGFSHRTNNEEELMQISAVAMTAETIFFNNYDRHSIKVKRFELNGKFKKEILLDNNLIKTKEHYGTLNVVMFSPEDLQIIKGEPALRRRFLDMEIAQTNRFYYALLVKYNKILQQRNKILKEAREYKLNQELLAAWTQELVKTAAEILTIRLKVVKSLNQIAQKIYGDLTNNQEQLMIKYEIKANNNQFIYDKEQEVVAWKQWYEEALKERQDLDVMRGNTGLGPHRDDLLVLVNNNKLKAFGSQGQQRSGALALKLSELEYVKKEKEEYPILLLDDVMSELDSERRRQLLEFINGKVQTFITVNDKTLIPELKANKYFHVKKGSIHEE
ncbi:MAG: DNA replication/repair protein RecF [Acidaminococcaceae bacterium]